MTEPRASYTLLEVRFSEAMRMSESRWRRFSCSCKWRYDRGHGDGGGGGGGGGDGSMLRRCHAPYHDVPKLWVGLLEVLVEHGAGGGARLHGPRRRAAGEGADE